MPFERAPKKPPAEPAGLEAFAAGAPNAVRLAPVVVAAAAPAALTPAAPTAALEAARAALPPPAPRPLHGMNVRFDDDEKVALELLSRVEGRSQHQILKRLLRPVLLAAAAAVTPSAVR